VRHVADEPVPFIIYASVNEAGFKIKLFEIFL
jgi:hypothetical protein